jgi:hypothetical protein
MNFNSLVDLHNLISNRLSEHRLIFFKYVKGYKINKFDLKKVTLIFYIQVLQYPT